MPSSLDPKRVLFVFAWLVVGGEETEVRLLAQNLDRSRYTLDVVACFRKPNMPEQTHCQLEALGVPVDKTPYSLSFEDTVEYLAHKIPHYDLVVACQAVPDVYPALERLAQRPPLIEHGGLVEEALRGPKHLTTRYVGVCDSIRQAAAQRMADRPHHALEIPSMVDLQEFDPTQRATVRQGWGVHDDTPVIGWVGRLDRKKRVEDFIRAAALVHRNHPTARFVVIGGPDAFMPEYADELQALGRELHLDAVLHFLGDRADVPRLLSGLDSFVWLSKGEGMPHVIAEAGAAGLPVVATCDNGTAEQITHGVTGLFVPHEAPTEVAAALDLLIRDQALRQRLGCNLQRKVQAEYSTGVVTRRWEALFDEVLRQEQVKQPRPFLAFVETGRVARSQTPRLKPTRIGRAQRERAS
ncbi:MAG: glycosyltransferase family 4 protein [Caldilineaceae bacterium]